MIYIQQLKALRDDLNIQREDLKEEIRNLPDGELFVMHRDSRNYYCQRLPKRGNRKKEVRRGITKDKGMLKKLVRKKYVEEAIVNVNFNLAALDSVIRQYKPFDENTLMRDFVWKNPDLTDYIYKDTSESDEWSANYERKKDFYEKDLTSVASDGTSMRSRGEIIIAEKLRQYKIPFRYEAGIQIPDLPYVPDFTIKRPKDGKIFYWEHIGDVNDEKYMERNALKFKFYERYGIVPWDNFIVTYDFQDGGVNVPLIEGMIHAWLL